MVGVRCECEWGWGLGAELVCIDKVQMAQRCLDSHPDLKVTSFALNFGKTGNGALVKER